MVESRGICWKVFKRFKMVNVKLVSTLAPHLKLSQEGFPKNVEEKEMHNTPCTSAVSSLIYAYAMQ